MDYQDGTSLIVKSTSTDVEFFEQGLIKFREKTAFFCFTFTFLGSHWQTYNQSNLPQLVKQRLEKMPQIIDRLLSGGGGSGKMHQQKQKYPRPASIR